MVMRNGPVIRAPAFYNDGTNYQLQNAQGIENINHVKFPATQVASSDVNALDDYEEGTFTPTIVDQSLDDEDQVHNIQVARYTKIGNRVFFQLRLRLSDLGSMTTTDAATIIGLPFTSVNVSSATSAVNVGSATSLAVTAGQSMTGYINPNSVNIEVRLWDDVGGVSALLISELSVTAKLTISGHYEVA